MLKAFVKHPDRYFYVIVIVYCLLGLFNLAYLPIVWTDEVMNLDPAVQFHKTGLYKGFLWPNTGSDQIFLSYPPLIQWVHILFLYIFPLDVFWTRLPFFCMHLASLILIYHTVLKISGNQRQWALLLSLLFMFDKVVFELSRSMRVEVVEIFLVAILIWLHVNRKKAIWMGLVCGLLLLAHLTMWPLVAGFVLYFYLDNTGQKEKGILTITCLVPAMVFLAYIGFDFSGLAQQMAQQTAKHSAMGGVMDRIMDFMFLRFWPVYKEQPWALLFTPILLFLSLRFVLQGFKTNLFALIFLTSSLAWMLFLAPHYRYWPPLFLIGIFLLASLTQKLKQPILISKPIWALTLCMITAGFLARHVLAILQRDERNPAQAAAWVAAHLDKNKNSLIIGEGIAFYLSQNSRVAYGIPFYPQNLHPEIFDAVFLLTREETTLPILDVYHPNPSKAPAFLLNLQKGETYNHMKWVRIENLKQWNQITGTFARDYEN